MAERSPNGLVSMYREMANDAAREREAIQWSEGLMGAWREDSEDTPSAGQ
jgi:hypothetical protein